MIERPMYVNKIMSYVDTPFVKILTGVRRCGKSTILKMIMEHLHKDHGVPNDRIVSYRFDSMEYEDMTAKEMYAELKGRLYQGKKTYFFLDEMQEIELITNLNMGAMMVATDKIDALITDSGAGELLLANNPDLEMAAFKFEFESEGNCGLVNLDEPELAALIEEALLAADQELDYDAIRTDMTNKAKALGLEVN